LSVDGLIVSGVTGGRVFGRARPVVTVDNSVFVIVGVIVGVVVAASVVVDGDLGNLDELLLVVGDHGGVTVVAVMVSAVSACCWEVVVEGIDALVLSE